MTRATERVESAPSSWAATPETCGAAMLVPLKLRVAVLLEPTYAARISWPGACVHGWRGLSASFPSLAGPRTRADVWQARDATHCGRKPCTRMWARGRGQHAAAKAAEGHLRLDASAVIGERGQRAPLSRGANEQLGRGSARIIPTSASFRGRVARRCHDHDLCAFRMNVRCMSGQPPIAHSRLLISVWPPCAAWLSSGAALTPGVVLELRLTCCARLRSAARRLW